MTLPKLACFAWLAAPVFAQPAPKFEVATIKLAAPDAVRNRMMPVSPDRLSIPSMTLTWLIYTAYGEGLGTQFNVTGGPTGLTGPPTPSKVWPRAFDTTPTPVDAAHPARRTLCVEDSQRNQEGDIYALVLDRSDGKLGPKVQAWDGTCTGGRMPTPDDDPVYPRCLSGYGRAGNSFGRRHDVLGCGSVVAPYVQEPLGRVVQDRTGLTGRYKMELEYKFPLPGGQAAPPDTSQPSLFTAIREQWGLKLEPAQGPFKVFAIEERPPADGKLGYFKKGHEMKRTAFTSMAALLLTAASMMAHHGYAEYDRNALVSLEGTVKHVLWANPHVVLTLETQTKGEFSVEWGLCSSSPGKASTLSR